MAYMDQERKARLVGLLKAAIGKWKTKYSVAVQNHSTIVLNIRECELDLLGCYNRKRAENLDSRGMEYQPQKDASVNPYHYGETFDGECLAFMKAAHAALNDGNHDRSDSQSDYFDVGWYVKINIGQWNKPFVCTGEPDNGPAADPDADEREAVEQQLQGELSKISALHRDLSDRAQAVVWESAEAIGQVMDQVSQAKLVSADYHDQARRAGLLVSGDVCLGFNQLVGCFELMLGDLKRQADRVASDEARNAAADQVAVPAAVPSIESADQRMGEVLKARLRDELGELVVELGDIGADLDRIGDWSAESIADMTDKLGEYDRQARGFIDQAGELGAADPDGRVRSSFEVCLGQIKCLSDRLQAELAGRAANDAKPAAPKVSGFPSYLRSKDEQNAWRLLGAVPSIVRLGNERQLGETLSELRKAKRCIDRQLSIQTNHNPERAMLASDLYDAAVRVGARLAQVVGPCAPDEVTVAAVRASHELIQRCSGSKRCSSDADVGAMFAQLLGLDAAGSES